MKIDAEAMARQISARAQVVGLKTAVDEMGEMLGKAKKLAGFNHPGPERVSSYLTSDPVARLPRR